MDFREPTEGEIVEMATAAQNAAAQKARELGFYPAISLVALVAAGDAAMKTMEVIDTIGLEATIEIAEAFMKAELYDLGREAEETLKEE